MRSAWSRSREPGGSIVTNGRSTRSIPSFGRRDARRASASASAGKPIRTPASCRICSKPSCSAVVVELGGVRRAAEQLYVTQPVVSAHLRTLQDRLGGAQLLYRDGRQMRVTEAGDAAYRWAKEVLSRSEDVVREIDGLAQGGA